MRVLVTGANGFIGAHVARALALRGVEVHGLVEPKSDTGRLSGVAVALHEADLTDRAATARVVNAVRPDTCVHLAWYAVPGKYLDAPENLDLVTASLDLARCLKGAGCTRLVGAGTCFEYDTRLGLLHESSPTAPQFVYSACKLALYEILRTFAPLANMSFAWCRFFYLYGPTEAPGRLVPHVIDRLCSGGTAEVTEGAQVRDFLHVHDVGTAVATVALSDLAGAVNVASGVPVTVRDLVSVIARVCDAEGRVRYGAVPYRAGDPMFVCADVDKLKKTGWAPRFDLESGLLDTVRARTGRGA